MENKQLSKNPVMEREQQPEILKSIIRLGFKKTKKIQKKIKNLLHFKLNCDSFNTIN